MRSTAAAVALAVALAIALALASPFSSLSTASTLTLTPFDLLPTLGQLPLDSDDDPSAGHLSIFSSAKRANETHAVAAKIRNEVREWEILGGERFPFYDGPVARPGSLAADVELQELGALLETTPDTPRLLAALAVELQPTFNSTEGFERFYEMFDSIMAAPRAALDHSDAGFARQRLTIRGFNMRLAKGNDDVSGVTHGYNTSSTITEVQYGPSTLTQDQIAAVCGAGATLQSLVRSRALFVVDVASMGAFRSIPDAADPKYVPSVVGHFCLNRDDDGAASLLPLSIALLDSGLTYSRFDTPSEWALAKAALNAAETAHQQLLHFVETHAVTIPLRVELMRHMATVHPVRALLDRHFAGDLALERQAGVVLFNVSTPLDHTFGIGARGSLEFLAHEFRSGRAMNTALRLGPIGDLRARGVHNLPSPYAAYATLHWRAIHTFVQSFVDVYYASDMDVRGDEELQAWSHGASQLTHLKEAWPTSIDDTATLVDLLSKLVFLTTVKHHAMNGQTTWETVAMPWSAPALWRPLPTVKGQALDVVSFLQPAQVFPQLVYLTALFNRPRAPEDTMPAAYGVAPFTHEPRLRPALEAFDRDLRDLDAFIVANERHERCPYHILRPGNLPHTSWI